MLLLSPIVIKQNNDDDDDDDDEDDDNINNDDDLLSLFWWSIIAVPESTCGATPLGEQVSQGHEWSDEAFALVHGSVTGIRIWTALFGEGRRYIQG